MNAQSPVILLRQSRIFLILFVIVATVATAVFSATAEPQHATSLSITVNRVHRQATQDYQYDGYYAIQASDLFSQTILSWFLTPSALLEFYQRAEVDPQIDSLGGLTGRFKARKFSAQNIVVQFSDPNRDNAEKLAKAIGAVVKERGESLNKDSDGENIFEVLPAAPVIVETRPSVALNSVVAFIASAIIAFVLVAARRYLGGAPDADRG
ncbi:MAG: hypothetical protein HY340_02185 [Candidatus Kerfeldbacteria bacterium]|nr:hypothetical protein [Candidatus Kerfeldbacteria bacterium]